MYGKSSEPARKTAVRFMKRGRNTNSAMEEVSPHEGHSSPLRSEPQLRHLVILAVGRLGNPWFAHQCTSARMRAPQTAREIRHMVLPAHYKAVLVGLPARETRRSW